MNLSRGFLRHNLTRATPLGILLVATVALASWLGYQAVDAVASHQRTASAVLRDYAGISATEMARIVRANMRDVVYGVFQFAARRRRGREPLPPEHLIREIAAVMRSQHCDCPGFHNPAALFRIDPLTRTAVMTPDTLPAPLRSYIVDAVLARIPTTSRAALGLLTTTTPPSAGDDPIAIGYLATVDTMNVPEPAYGFVVTGEALGELFRHWYENNPLLPQPIARDQPNDSLLYVAIRNMFGHAYFESSDAYEAEEPGASVTVQSEFGDFLIQATVRPDAAGHLIIGGLPRSRLPLLATLLMLTLGVGVAAFVQLRREQIFQRLREDFVSGVSHELRTPLAQIRMFSELQQSGKLLSDEDRERAVFVIHREAKRLSHLVENILQFSKLRRTPWLAIPRERLDLTDALAEGIDAISPLLEDRGMDLDFVTEPGVIVHANREALTRIVVNLLDNAVKYGPRGQTITVQVSKRNGSAYLAVTDEGPGVPEADREHIWQPYARLERDVKAQLPGTGIGLSVVRDLARLHDGRAWVEDAPSGGARFVVQFPLAVEVAEPVKVA